MRSICPNCGGSGKDPKVKQPKSGYGVIYCIHCHGNGNDTWADFLESSDRKRVEYTQAGGSASQDDIVRSA
jgi:hypothetical protein